MRLQQLTSAADCCSPCLHMLMELSAFEVVCMGSDWPHLIVMTATIVQHYHSRYKLHVALA